MNPQEEPVTLAPRKQTRAQAHVSRTLPREAPEPQERSTLSSGCCLGIFSVLQFSTTKALLNFFLVGLRGKYYWVP